MKQLLFTTPTCHPCIVIRDEVPPDEYGYKVVDVTTDKGQELYNDFGLGGGVPRFVEVKDNGDVKRTSSSINEIIKWVK